MRVGQARKRDEAELPIVAALRRAGAQVLRVSEKGAPDLVVCYRRAVYLFEVKGPRGRVTPAQATTQQLGWPVVTVRTAQEALQAIGAGRAA